MSEHTHGPDFRQGARGWSNEGSGSARDVRHPNPNRGREFRVHLVLRDGFRGHMVVIAVNGLEVLRRGGVTTATITSRPEIVEVTTASPTAQITIAATPGSFSGSLDLDMATHRHVVI